MVAGRTEGTVIIDQSAGVHRKVGQVPREHRLCPEAGHRSRAEIVRGSLETVPPPGDADRRVLPIDPGPAARGPWTLEQIARELGVTRERVRQIEASALRKLRESPRSRGLKDFWE